LQSNKEPVHLSPRQQRNKQIIEQFKSKPCKDCGNLFSIWQMDFDHIRKDKIKNVGHLAMSGSTESLLEEIAKCEVVCSICHRNRTFSRKKTELDTPEIGLTG
jgi:L-lysine 2,3-aminomutase